MRNLNQEQKKVKIKEKKNTFEILNGFYEGRELLLNAFTSGILSIKATQRKRSPSDLATQLKIVTSKQML